MRYAIRVTPHILAGTLGQMMTEPHLLRDYETRVIETFETREDAQARVDALDAESPYILRNGEYAPPDYEVLDLGVMPDARELSSEDDDIDVPDEWEPLARAVAEALRQDESLTFADFEGDEIVSDEGAFGLRAYVAAPQVLIDLAEVEGREWWYHIDFAPSHRAVRGEFEAPTDRVELDEVIDWLRARDALDRVDLDALPELDD